MKTKKKSRLTNGFSKPIDDCLHKISFREIKILWNILRDVSSAKSDFVRAKFLQDGLHYSEITGFLAALGLLRLTKTQIGKIGHLGKTDDDMKSALVLRLLASSTRYRPHVNAFLGNFQNFDGRFQILMDSEKRHKFGGLRNWLLDFEFLDHDLGGPSYCVSLQYLSAFLEAKSNFSKSPQELHDILLAREKLGHDAEIEVLKFEMSRLRDYPGLVKRIKHIATENVSAGYDVFSLTEAANGREFSDRLIEVKAVSASDYKFYWSRNEIETARLHGSNYFLYLVPVFKNGFDMKKLKILQNPFKNVYSDDKYWQRQEEVVSFTSLHFHE